MSKKSVMLPDASYLHECFAYDAETGELRWRVRPIGHFLSASRWKSCNKRFAGKLVGVVNGSGYVLICLDYRLYFAHRVIWKLVTGSDPTVIDHENGVRHDNRWSNLREANDSENQWNRRVGKHNVLGLKGVRQQPSGRFGAYIWMPTGKSRWLGTFSTAEEAHAAYCEAARELGGEFASPG